ncbi:MAG: BamA/TamA family outer membrane protein [Acidobacteria bacterium]|nr:BamA/TamA family outer membrane protein [Acidobacteriota bacterium]
MAGGVGRGGGIGFGPEYLRRDLPGGAILRAAAQLSFRAYQTYDLRMAFPQLAGGRLFTSLHSVHRNYPRVNYYGPGAASISQNRTDFRLEDTQFTGLIGFRLTPRLRLGTSLGYLLFNVGPGTDLQYLNTERVFTPAQTPGIDQQSTFVRNSAFVHLDYRDDKRSPSRGGNYFVEYSRYDDRKLNRHEFQTLELELQQYIPLSNDKDRVIALRGRSVLSFRDTDQRVPFYLQPILGGARDMRGFRTSRFYDDNLMALTAEYSWQTFRHTYMALFIDAGKVFPELPQWNLTGMQHTVGFGVRINNRGPVSARLDVGFSREGARVWLRLDSAFRAAPAILADIP